MKRVYSILSIVCFFLIIILALYVWYPKYQEFNQTRDDLKEKKETLEETQEILEELAKTKKELVDYDIIINKFNKALSEEDFSLVDLNIFLRKSVPEYGLFLENISIGEAGKEVDVNLSLSGSYNAFVNYLSFLHQNYKLFKIKDFSFTADQESEIWNFNLKLTTYYASLVEEASPELEETFEEMEEIE